jgi:parvulin-like peptidyl-prolyl isomerase
VRGRARWARSAALACAALASHALPGCGGGQPSPAPAAAATSTDEASPSAEERCLATANARRERRASEPGRVKAQHVLVKHADVKTKVPTITRTRGQACLRAMSARDELVAGADWDAVVGKLSDEPGAASRSGLVGEVERAEVAPAFADALFELEPGQVSDVVETEHGFHVIRRP